MIKVSLILHLDLYLTTYTYYIIYIIERVFIYMNIIVYYIIKIIYLYNMNNNYYYLFKG